MQREITKQGVELGEDALFTIGVLKLIEYVSDQIEWGCRNARASGDDRAFIHITYNAYKQYLVALLGDDYYKYVLFFRQAWIEMVEEVIRLYDGTQIMRYPDRYGLFRYTFKVLCQ